MINYTKEIWRTINEFPNYEVSNLGNVRNKKTKRVLKPTKNNNGYLCVSLYRSGIKKNHYIHRLVAEAYLDNLNNYNEVSHLDETRDNNCVNNLAWVSYSENRNMPKYKERMSKANTNNPKTSRPVRCLETKALYASVREAERQTGIVHQNISACCRGKQKTTGKLHWMYEEDYQDMIVAELLEKTFLNEENESETDGSELVTVCGALLNEYLQTKNN